MPSSVCRSSYRCSYSLDNLATRAYSMDAIQGVSDDEDEPAKAGVKIGVSTVTIAAFTRPESC